MNIDGPKVSQIPDLRRLWREAFGDTEEFLDDFFKTAFSAKRCRLVTRNDEVVAALYWFDCFYKDKPIAYLYAVATAKDCRGQGICHKLMKDTHRHLSALGYEGVILVPGNRELFKFYEGMGYQLCSYIREFQCIVEDKKVEVRPVNLEEYAKLRLNRLPEGGVIQEKENLDFLKTQATFYAGEDFLLAAYGKEDTLYGVELLGDDSFATGVLKALGYKKGIFRAPGKDTPFAMYRPLKESNLLSPIYFGFAFD